MGRARAAKTKDQGMDLEALMALGKRLDKRTGRGSYREVLASSLLQSPQQARPAGEAGEPTWRSGNLN